jgi:hypothetical protein
MKRFWSLSLILVLLMTLTYGLTAGADTSEMIPVFRNLIKVEANGQTVTMDNFLYNNRTYVPMREVAELLGKDVRWNAYTKTAGINDMIFEKTALSALLPTEIGYKWIYNGFAEYGHTMTLDRIEDLIDRRTYFISGAVDDMSDGEGTFNRDLSIKYTLIGNAMIQEKTEQMMLDSKFNRLTLIETPLVAGTTWTETIPDKTGKMTKIDAIIRKVEVVDGKMQYTIHYDDVASAYYEERVIREGVGVISLEKLLELGEEPFPASYFLFMSGIMSEVPMTLYFGTPMADGVLPETRIMLVADGAVAKAAVQGLIWGPQSQGLVATIPEGTRLLNISILNGICTVDFSKEFVDNHSGGSAGEIMTLSSIITTLKQFDSISRVAILVEGKTGATLGNILLGSPMD